MDRIRALTMVTLTCIPTLACSGEPPAGTFVQVSAGGEFACGVRPDGTPVCWGRDYSGYCEPPAGTYTQISAGNNHACGVKTDGNVVCWGDNGSRQNKVPASAFGS
jgi:alpha-tubulin suppressor-like RCC1 family protein